MHSNTVGRQHLIEENSMHAALNSFGYSELIDKHSQNLVMPGLAVPLNPAEAIHSLGANRFVNPDEFCDARDFTTGSSYPQFGGRFMESVPLSISALQMEGFGSVANEEKFKMAVTNNVGNSSFEAMNCDYDDLVFETNTRWDLHRFINPSELIGRVSGRTGNQPTGGCLPNEWMLTEQQGSPGSSRFSHELSLSLATSTAQGNSTQELCSEISSSGATSYSLHNRPNVMSEHASSSSSYKPIQISPLLSGSRFLHAMQEIFSEIARYALENTGTDNGVNFPISSTANGVDPDSDMFQDHLFQEGKVKAKKEHLLALLQVVDERYNQCLHQIHTVSSAFHAVTELDPNLHARFALPMISSMYKSLRERISSHILPIGEHLVEGEASEAKSPETRFVQQQWALQQLSKRDHQLWRPQRGLPERSVSILRAWMFQNFLHPYPKDAEKHLLALKSGLTRNQVSNWFINARVRLWKPMIEEMYAEMNRRKGRK